MWCNDTSKAEQTEAIRQVRAQGHHAQPCDSTMFFKGMRMDHGKPVTCEWDRIPTMAYELWLDNDDQWMEIRKHFGG